MRKYPLYDLSDEEFENLVVLICRKILGEGTIPFATGTDGGRDAKFNGQTNCFPSESLPWNGKIVIQAKHTTKINASCSDSFFKTRLKNEVLPAISRLKGLKKIEYYMLFTNAKLTGKQDEKIEDLLENDNPDIPNIIIADEKIQQWLNSYPDIVRDAKLNELLRPLQFDESDLKEVILEFSKNLPAKNELSSDFSYIPLDKKNEINLLSKTYFDDVIKGNFTHFESISDFLKDPINYRLKELFEDTISELNAKITLKRDDYAAFEKLLEDLYDHVIDNNPDLNKSGKKRLIRVFLHYMYCNCDIGKKEDA